MRATLHSITSVARIMIDSGGVRPRAFAVLRLTKSNKLVREAPRAPHAAGSLTSSLDIPRTHPGAPEQVIALVKEPNRAIVCPT
jgi:hypothetical protein